MATDEALMAAFQRGSRDALEELFARYRAPLYGFFRRRLPDRAQDLTQETFLAVMRAASRYEPRATVRTYLYAIALNLLTGERRKRSRVETSLRLHEPSQNPAVESALWIRQAIEKLDGTDREIVMLREYEQLSYSEIADLLHIPLNTVRSRLFRARLALRELLAPSEVEHG